MEVKFKFESDGDSSKQYDLISETGNFVHFAVLDNELCAHTWHCPNEGRVFLEELERYAESKGLKLTIPTVINPKLQKILLDNGYHTTQIEWFPEPDCFELVDIWVKN